MPDFVQVQKIINKEKISFVYLQFSDLLGQVKNVVITVEKFLEDACKGGVWFDGSSVEGFARIAESDMLLRPDLSTFVVLPWSEEKRRAARVICNIHDASGKRLTVDPRYILERMLGEIRGRGLSFYVGAEFEFYLFEREFLPSLVPHDDKSYFDYTPSSRASLICESTMKALESFGIKGETHHHEVAKGQHEIDILYDKALTTADNVMTIKMALKAYSAGTELKSTWMPKPLFGHNGNGLHVHQSLWKDGKNIFYDRKNEYGLSKIALCFIAGQLYHSRAISAIVSPSVNSYKRLVPGYEAPVYICWGRNNRSALIRIPRVQKEKVTKSTRLEYRAPDPSCNPYLAFAALLAAGLDGIENKMEAPVPSEENVYCLDQKELTKNSIKTLPENLDQALRALEKDKVILDIFAGFGDRFIKIKKDEWKQYSTQVSPWEIERYF